MQVGQPAGALAHPARLIEQAVADQVAPVQLGIVIFAGVFRCGPGRGPQLSQRGIQPVQVRAGRDLVHPRRREPRPATGARMETPSARAETSAQRRSRSALLQAPHRPRHPRQQPPFPPPGGHLVRGHHADTLPMPGGVQQDWTA